MKYLLKSAVFALVICCSISGSTELFAHDMEYVLYKTLLHGDEVVVEGYDATLGPITFNYADESSHTITVPSAGTFDCNNTAVPVSVTINGQTVAAGQSGEISLPSGTTFTLTVEAGS